MVDADNQAQDVIATHLRIRRSAVVSLGDIRPPVRHSQDDAVRNKCVPRLQQNYVTQAGPVDKGPHGNFPGWPQGIAHTPAPDPKRHIPAALEKHLQQLFGDLCRRKFRSWLVAKHSCLLQK